MFRIFVFLLCLLSSYLGYSQNLPQEFYTPKQLARQTPISLAQANTERQSAYVVYVPVNYSKSVFSEESQKALAKLQGRFIERVDLMYTVFRRNPNFDQTALNQIRYQQLKKHLPEAFQTNMTAWQLVAQDGTMDYEEAQGYFHGFVIYIRPHRLVTKNGQLIESAFDLRVDLPSTKKYDTEEEIDFIERVLAERPISRTAYFGHPANKGGIRGMRITSGTPDTGYLLQIDTSQYWNNRYYPHHKGRFAKGITYATRGFSRPKVYLPKYDSSYLPDPIPTYDTSYFNNATANEDYQHGYDSLVSDWDNYLIVHDVTGSMFPYLAQTFLYHRDRLEKTKSEKIVFFNDGDNYPDGLLAVRAGLILCLQKP